MPAVERLECPGCGQPVSLEDTACEYCGSKITFVSSNYTTVKNATTKQASKLLDAYKGALEGSQDNPLIQASLGFALFECGQYKEACEHLSKAAPMLNKADVFFIRSIARYKSKKAFQITKEEAEEIINDVDAAISLETGAHFIYAKSCLVRKLFEEKYLRYSSSSQELKTEARRKGLTLADEQEVNSLILNS